MTLSVHHLAKVVESIEQAYAQYQQLGYQTAAGFLEPQDDLEQKVKVGVMVSGNLTLELLEPLSETSPVYNFLSSGGGFHHLCYQTEDLQASITEIEHKKLAKRVTAVTTSVWDGRPVVFFLTANQELFEIIGPKL